jgi:putative ribosome biogenesis GTPase RsgA
MQVVSAEANFVRVNLSHLEGSSSSSSSSSRQDGAVSSSTTSTSIPDAQQPGSTQPATPPVKQLLCTVRALLKKIGQRVLVGDHVRVNPIDWTAARGVVDSVQTRTSELADPAVANVDHVLLLFGLTQPPVSGDCCSRMQDCTGGI